MKQVRLLSSDGFRVVINPEKVTAIGLDPGSKDRCFVIADGREYATSHRAKTQYHRVAKVLGWTARQKRTPSRGFVAKAEK